MRPFSPARAPPLTRMRATGLDQNSGARIHGESTGERGAIGRPWVLLTLTRGGGMVAKYFAPELRTDPEKQLAFEKKLFAVRL